MCLIWLFAQSWNLGKTEALFLSKSCQGPWTWNPSLWSRSFQLYSKLHFPLSHYHRRFFDWAWQRTCNLPTGKSWIFCSCFGSSSTWNADKSWPTWRTLIAALTSVSCHSAPYFCCACQRSMPLLQSACLEWQFKCRRLTWWSKGRTGRFQLGSKLCFRRSQHSCVANSFLRSLQAGQSTGWECWIRTEIPSSHRRGTEKSYRLQKETKSCLSGSCKIRTGTWAPVSLAHT